MTLILRTRSHGKIEAGFYAAFTQFSRLGEYTFATSHLCEVAKQLAENPTARKGIILSYDVSKFWARQGEFIDEVADKAIEAGKSSSPDAVKMALDSAILAQQRQVPVEDDFDLRNEGRSVSIQVSKDYRLIKIGKYSISALEFGRMAVYLVRGGIIGWLNDKKPEFAEPAINAIKTSKNPLYRSIRRELRT